MTESSFSIEPLWTARLILDPLVGDSKVAAEMVQVLADPALYLHTGGAPPTLSELSARFTRQAPFPSSGAGLSGAASCSNSADQPL